MVHDATVEYYHESEGHSRIDKKMEVVPHRINFILASLRIDRAVIVIEAGEERQVNVRCGKDSYDARDDDENTFRLTEPRSCETAERQVSIEADEDT